VALRQAPNVFNEHNMLTPIQCKMARAALGWGVKDLAEKANIAANTVVRFENEKHEANPSTQTMIKQAFEAAGVRFSEDGGVLPPGKKGS
jgi:DNA-binding XRE family transcriptional regulator